MSAGSLNGGSVRILWDATTSATVTITGVSAVNFTVGGAGVTFPYTLSASTTFDTSIDGDYTVSVLHQGYEVANTPDGTKPVRLARGGTLTFAPTVDATPDNKFLSSLSATYARVYGVSGVADLQSQFNAAAVTGGVVLLPTGALALTAALSVPPNLTKRVVIRGQGVGATTVTLSNAAPRFIDLKGRTADGDIYRNVTVEDLTVDASAVTANANHDGNAANHGIIGTMSGSIGATPMYRVSLSDITIRRVQGVGGPVNTNGTNQFFWIAVASSVDSADPQQTIDRILIEDVDLAGGDTGIYVGAFARTGGGFANVILDDVTVRRWKHVLPSTPASPFAVGNHVILGHHGIGKRGYIGPGYGLNCGDVGVEVDTWDDILVEQATVEDAANASFYVTQFAAPLTPTAQRARFRNCTAKRTNYSPAVGIIGNAGATQGYGWWLNPNATYGRPGPVTLEDCAFIRTATDSGVLGSAIYADSAQRLTLVRFLSDESSVTGRNVAASAVRVRPAAGNTTFVKMDRCRFQVAGSLGTGAGLWSAVHFVQGQVVFDLDDITVDYNVTTPGATSCRAIYLGDDSLSTIVGGTIKRARFAQASDSSGWLIVAGHTGTTTYQPRVLLDDCSPRLPGTANVSTETRALLTYRAGSGSQQAYDGVLVRASSLGSSKYPTVPIALSPSGSPYTYRNQDGLAQRVVAQGGVVTAVEWSQDGSTFYNLGVTAGVFRLEAGDYLRTTYSSVPTMTKIFEKQS